MDAKETPVKKTPRLKDKNELTFDEIKMRQLVTQMKINIEKERLLSTILPGATPTETALANNINRIDTYLQYASIGIATFKTVKKAINFLKSLKNKS